VWPVEGGPVKTLLQFRLVTGPTKGRFHSPGGYGYHVLDNRVSGFHSDDPDLEYLRTCTTGLKQKP